MKFKKENKWALILGLLNVAYFAISYGIGYLPGLTGWIGIDSIVALVIGVNLILYYFLKK